MKTYVELGFAESTGSMKSDMFDPNQVVARYELGRDREGEAGEIVRWPLDRATAVGCGAELCDLKKGSSSVTKVQLAIEPPLPPTLNQTLPVPPNVAAVCPEGTLAI